MRREAPIESASASAPPWSLVSAGPAARGGDTGTA